MTVLVIIELQVKTRTSGRSKTMKKIQDSKKGICLMEMVLVVAIICVLASVLLYNFVGILHYLETI